MINNFFKAERGGKPHSLFAVWKKCLSLQGLSKKIALMKHLTELQRYNIYIELQNGLSRSQIANKLGVNRSTISRELNKNCDMRSGKYNPELAQRKYKTRLKQRKRRYSLTVQVKQHIYDLIQKEYSPKQVVGWCRINGITMVSHETIYKYIWGLNGAMTIH